MSETKRVFDPTHSELGFKIRHLMITNVSGSFQKFEVEVEMENDKFENARIVATADINSINTNNTQRDQHLRTSDFFEAEKYPQLKFRSTKVERVDEETFDLLGDLTLKGVTKQVKLKVEYSNLIKDPWGNERAGFVVTGKIKRSDWGINFNGVLETGGLMLGEDVSINSEIEILKQAVAIPA